MRIIIDLQGMQSLGNSSRGIGRYSRSLIKSLIKNSSEDHFILVANSLLEDIKTEFAHELTCENSNVSYITWSGIGPTNFSDSTNLLRFKLAENIRSYCFSKLKADVILITSFFDGYHDNAVLPININYDLPPVFCIVHDLIPFIYPKDYLDKDIIYKNFYLKMIDEICKVNFFLTNSRSTASELFSNLPIDENNVFNISSGCDQRVFNQKPVNEDINSRDLPKKYILYCGAMDVRKNVRKLIIAYSLLSKEIKNEYKLVFVGKLTSFEVEQLKMWVKEFGINTDSILILGYVTDNELAEIYRRCSLFIMTSIHEGFGLPLIEAMNCGAPVVGSNITSIPEVIGMNEALFNPKDVKSISNVIYLALTNEDLQRKLKENANHRSKLFSWDKSANEALDIFRRLLVNKDNRQPVESYTIFKSQINNIFNELESQQFTDLDISRLSACIDLINLQINSLNKFHGTNNYSSWRIEGPFDSNYSLAILNRAYVLSLLKLSNKVKICITEGNGDYEPDINFLKGTDEIYRLYLNSKKKKSTCSIVSRNLYPPTVTKMNGSINMMHAYGWEETQFPLEWSYSFNKHLDCITVMSDFVKKILIDNGVSIPIRVCHLGVDHISESSTSSNYQIKAKKFRFLHISSCFPRKGVNCLLKAYEKAFTRDDDVTLVVKTFPNPHNDLRHQLNILKDKNDHFPDVLIIEDDLDIEEIRSLYTSCDVLVAPSHGEGFGLPIAEAMLLKLPVITTAWGGQIDFCNSNNSWLIDYKFSYSKTHFGLQSSVWANPSIVHCSKLMKEVYDLDSSAINSKTSAAYNTIKNARFTWDCVAKSNVSFVENITNSNHNRLPRIGWVTPWNTKCGIASYSENLINAMEDSIVILSPKDEKLLGNDTSQVRRCWSLSEGSLLELYKKIVEEKFTTVVFQFNYGFFDFSELNIIIHKLVNINVKVIIFFHSTIDNKLLPAKSLNLLSQSLSSCSRLLVHTPSDMNRLKDIGLVDNVTLFSHGLLDYNNSQNNVRKSKKDLRKISKNINLSSFGFCLPNKGFPQLIKSIPILKKNGFDVKLDMLNAIYNDQYEWFFYEMLNLISSLNLQNEVTINGNYLSNQESLDILSNSDLIIFPYQSTNESSSAAVRHGLASGAPVAVTPLPIFDDVSEVVHYLPGISSIEIAEGVIKWIANDYLEKSNREKWIDANRFSTLGIKLEGLIRSLEVNE